MRQKLIYVTGKIFTVGIIAMLMSGILAAMFYVVAFFAGGVPAEQIVAFVNEKAFPVLFVWNIMFCVYGILHVYLIGDRGFRFDIGKKQAHTEK